MATHIVLLRGINLGANNRIAMPVLREALTEAGMQEVRTYVQSGNIVLASDLEPSALADTVRRVLAALGLAVPLVIRSPAELSDVVARNPFAAEAQANPKALQVTFRSQPPDPGRVCALEELAAPGEKVVGIGRELYSWHPDGIARSKLALALTGKDEPTTTRNWSTVTKLMELARA